jgi:hypothetical protein
MYRYLMALLAAVSLSAAVHARSADPAELQALALEMLEVTGAADMGNLMVDQMLPMMEPSFRQGYPNASDAQIAEALAIFAEGFRARNDQMNRDIAEIYEDLLSADDMRAIIAFYRTPAGQRVLEAMPVAMERAGILGERIAQDILATEGARMEAVLTGGAPDQ